MLSKLLLPVCLLAGCASPVPQVIRILPPAELIQDCPVPQVKLRTNGDMANHIVDLRSALKSCNNDKAALRDWAKESDGGR